MTPIRAIIVGPPRLHNSKASIAVCNSGKSDSFFGNFVMWSAASFSVSSFRPSGKMMGSSNGADQGNNFTQAMILGVPQQNTLFLAACQIVHGLYYSRLCEKR